MNNKVKSAARVLDVLELLMATPEPLGASEIARRLGLAKSSTFMLLSTLEQRGYVQRGDGNSYVLASPLKKSESWIGGYIGLLLGVARSEMRELVERTRESSFLGILTGDFQLQYIEKAVSPQEIRYDADIRKLRPAYCTSVGLVLLAYQPKADVESWLLREKLQALTANTITDPKALLEKLEVIREQGYATTVDTHHVGAAGVAQPIFDPNGRPMAALNVSAPTSRFNGECETLKLELSNSVQRISRFLMAPALAEKAG